VRYREPPTSDPVRTPPTPKRPYGEAPEATPYRLKPPVSAEGKFLLKDRSRVWRQPALLWLASVRLRVPYGTEGLRFES